MTSFESDLPARPSLEQLRKQAKGLLRARRDGDTDAVARFSRVVPKLDDAARAHAANLADAQFVLAREHGFESWAALARHVRTLEPARYREHCEKVAADVDLAYAGDQAALQRVNATFLAGSLELDELRALLQQRDPVTPRLQTTPPPLEPGAALRLVARLHGVESWPAFTELLDRNPEGVLSRPIMLAESDPFYSIDWAAQTIKPWALAGDNGWPELQAVMERLQLPALHAGGLMTDAALNGLARLPFVTRLDLSGCRRLTEAGLAALGRMPQLQTLSMSDRVDSWVRDTTLTVLEHLPALRALSLLGQRTVTDAGLGFLTRCDNLEELDLRGTRTGDRAIEALSGKGSLRILRVGEQTTDRGLLLLHELPAFKTWRGRGGNDEADLGLESVEGRPTHLAVDGPITNRGLANLAGLNGLSGVSFGSLPLTVTRRGLERLRQLPNLTFLAWEGEHCTDEALEEIATWPALRSLFVEGAIARGPGFAALGRLTSLEYLWARGCERIGWALEALASLPALRGLAMGYKDFPAPGWAKLRDMASLEVLAPMVANDAAFRWIGLCKGLKELLCIESRGIGDQATEHIANLTLERFVACDTQITDRSLEILAGMPSLRRIELRCCHRVTAAGVARLRALPHLQELCIDDPDRTVGRAATSGFSPHVRVRYRS